MPSRHMHAVGKRFNVKRLRVIPINSISNATQPH
jgi:hypothetical protein